MTLPPRWSERLLRASLPADSMRDAIVGDLHQELVRVEADIRKATREHNAFLKELGVPLLPGS